jgi:hypothetical protein
MVQTKYNGLFVAPSGHRFVMQSGTHAFGNTLTVTLTVQMKRLVCAIITPSQVIAQKHTSTVGSYLAFVSASQLTITGLPTPYRVVVSRLRKNMAALKFAYSLVGW